MVISYEINENLMGNRGSKSKLVKRTTNFVKEQRVDGN
jgi:hypothetical protein